MEQEYCEKLSGNLQCLRTRGKVEEGFGMIIDGWVLELHHIQASSHGKGSQLYCIVFLVYWSILTKAFHNQVHSGRENIIHQICGGFINIAVYSADFYVKCIFSLVSMFLVFFYSMYGVSVWPHDAPTVAVSRFCVYNPYVSVHSVRTY